LVEYEKGFCGERENMEFFEQMIINQDNTINIKLV